MLANLGAVASTLRHGRTNSMQRKHSRMVAIEPIKQYIPSIGPMTGKIAASNAMQREGGGTPCIMR